MDDQPVPSENVLAVLRGGQELANWIDRHQDGMEVAGGRAKHIPAAMLGLVIEHHMGILDLVARQHFGSAFALVRPQFDALVRGIWLDRCASDEELKTFREKDQLPKRAGREISFRGMIDEVEQHDDFGDKVFSQLQHRSWRAMNSFTHGGMQQVTRRLKGNSIEPNYGDDEVIEVLRASGTFGLLALQQAAEMAKRPDVIAAVQEKLSAGASGESR